MILQNIPKAFQRFTDPDPSRKNPASQLALHRFLREGKNEPVPSLGNVPGNDYMAYVQKLFQICRNRGYQLESLGTVQGKDIFLATPRSFRNRKNVLVSAGFHGEEPAGCWGILHFLKKASDDLLLGRVNLSFIPIANPYGFSKNTRFNADRQNVNTQFFADDQQKPTNHSFTDEGKILMAQFARLRKLANSGFLSLHEDSTMGKYYIYTFEQGEGPGEFSEALKGTERKFFPQYEKDVFRGLKVQNGIIFKYEDGSFEEYLFKHGVPYTAATETPGRASMGKRVVCNARLIETMINFVKENG